MEFRRNLEEIRQERRSASTETFSIDLAKRRINEVLFEIMPPLTTLEDIEGFALAILQTVQVAWNDYDNVELVRKELGPR